MSKCRIEWCTNHVTSTASRGPYANLCSEHYELQRRQQGANIAKGIHKKRGGPAPKGNGQVVLDPSPDTDGATVDAILELMSAAKQLHRAKTLYARARKRMDEAVHVLGQRGADG